MTRKEYKRIISRIENIMGESKSIRVTYVIELHMNKRTIKYDIFNRGHVYRYRSNRDKIRRSRVNDMFNLTNFDEIEPRDIKRINHININGKNINR